MAVLVSAILLAPSAFAGASSPPTAAPDGKFAQPEALVSGPTGGDPRPRLALESPSDFWVWWREKSGNYYDGWAVEYRASAGWAAAAKFEQNRSGDSYPVGVAGDGSGNATALWQQSDGTNYHIWSAAYNESAGWGSERALDPAGLGTSIYARMASAQGGEAWAVWAQENGSSRLALWAAHYVPGSGWQNATVLAFNASWHVSSPAIAISANGNATAAWVFYEDLYTSHYSPGSGWSAARLVSLSPGNALSNPLVAMDDDGEATLADTANNGSAHGLWVVHAPANGTWGSPTRRSAWNRTVEAFDLAAGATGQAVLAWAQWDFSQSWTTCADLFTPPTGWEGEQLLGGSANSADAPTAVVAGDGNATVVWEDPLGASGLPRASRHIAGQGWLASSEVATAMEGSVEYPEAAPLPGGLALTVWQQANSSGSYVWASFYALGDFVPPALNLTAPLNNTTVEVAAVWVAGSTEAGARLVINGLVVDVGADGSFGLAVPLLPGNGTITATATDAAGNAASVSLNITFADPVPALRANLSEAAARLNSTAALLNDTLALLNATRSNLYATQSRLDLAWAQANATASELARAEGALAAVWFQLNQTGGNVSDLSAALALLNGTVSQAQAEIAGLDAESKALGAALSSLAEGLDDLGGRQNVTAADMLALETKATAAQAALAGLGTQLSRLSDALNGTAAGLAGAEANRSALAARVSAAERAASEDATRLAELEADKARADARANATEGENARLAARADEAARQAGLAELVGLGGLGVAAAAVVLGLRKRRTKAASEPRENP